MKYSFTTDLSIDNCKNKLKELIIEGKRTGIAGKISNHKHTFWIIQRPLNYVNNFQRVFYGELISCKEKILIRGSFNIPKTVKILLRTVYGFIMLCLGFVIYGLIHAIVIGKNDEIGRMVGGIFFILMIGIVANVMNNIMSNRNASQEKYIIGLLSNKLAAKEFKK